MASRLKDDAAVNRSNENEDLLVFGYSCKLFRDDEKALYIDQGKHLIPWMGDDTLKIDRYDARGTLVDLKQVEAPSGGFDRFFGLTDMEKQVESMCDDERYRALIANEEEETMYQEEELKRLHYAIGDKGNSYGQVEYKYEGESNNVEDTAEKPPIDKPALDGAEDELFVPPPQLDVPLNMVLPVTVKHNAIIERTAMFISNEGPQMEILLKTKQAENPQFNFLSFDNPLHSYYRHLLMAIRDGRYNPDCENSNEKTEVENDEDDHYLHPSLASSVSKVELAPSIPSINYKPSAHCAYSMLVNKIKDKKSNDQATHLSKLKEALENLTEGNEPGKESDNKRFHCSSNQNLEAQSFPTPPGEMQAIIDKMAFYVIKNGRDFEAVVQTKNDPRFDFLDAEHEFNCYYQYKIKQYENLEKSSALEVKIKSENSNSKLKEEHSKSKLAPVCFSIKKPKDSEPVIEKSALPVEESSDEEEKDDRETNTSEEREREAKEEVVTIDLAALEEKEEKNKKILATERIKDKLTAAAREKVAMATKEKQLQLDRKRRAAAFLRTINPDGKSSAPGGPLTPEAAERELEGGDLPAGVLTPSEEVGADKGERAKRAEEPRQKPGRPSGDEHEKRPRRSYSEFRLKHREKRRSKLEKSQKPFVDVERIKDVNDRVAESSPSSEEDVKKRGFGFDKARKSEESSWKKKISRNSSFRNDEKKHKKKKHKKDEVLDRSSRKHSKLKGEKRSRNEVEGSIAKSKRSRRDSTSSSNQNS